nr:uncharacterized protein LOC101866346 isoform X1 [Macaca fascicularis]
MSSRGSDLFWQVSPALQELLVLWAAARGQETTSPNPADRISERKAYGKLPRTDLAHAGKTPRCQGRRQSICGSSLPITGGKEYSRTGIGRLHAAVTALGSGFFHLETPGGGHCCNACATDQNRPKLSEGWDRLRLLNAYVVE